MGYFFAVALTRYGFARAAVRALVVADRGYKRVTARLEQGLDAKTKWPGASRWVLVSLIAASFVVAGAVGGAVRRQPPAPGPLGIDSARQPASKPAALVPANFPFVPPPGLRPTDPTDALPSLYEDGRPCSVGCRAVGAVDGWPLDPQNAQHALRAGLNELRPAGFHVGLDIQANDGAKVYALQPGRVQIPSRSGGDARIQVGNFVYWHVQALVPSGTEVAAHAQAIGTVMKHYGHLALSELGPRGEYLNPLRPGGRVLSPWQDAVPPAVAYPQVAPDGRVTVASFDPQSFEQTTTYRTPVLAPAALAYRLTDSSGKPVTGLEWVFRGTHLLEPPLIRRVFAPSAHAPGFDCFASRPLCVPDWVYWLAGGAARPLPRNLAQGSYRLTIYAWDWADNKSALDAGLKLTDAGWSLEPASEQSPVPSASVVH